MKYIVMIDRGVDPDDFQLIENGSHIFENYWDAERYALSASVDEDEEIYIAKVEAKIQTQVSKTVSGV